MSDGAEGEIRTRELLRDSPFVMRFHEVRDLSPAPLTWLGNLRIQMRIFQMCLLTVSNLSSESKETLLDEIDSIGFNLLF
jgi:hypothetical protein